MKSEASKAICSLSLSPYHLITSSLSLPRPHRPKRRSEEIHECSDFRCEVAAFGVERVDRELDGFEVGEDLFECAGAQLITNIERGQQHNAGACDRGSAVHQAIVRLQCAADGHDVRFALNIGEA